MLTKPVCAALSKGQVMVRVGVAQALQVTTLVVKSGGTDGCVQVAWSPVQVSWIVYVASHVDAVSAAWAVKQYSVVKMGMGIGVGVGVCTRVLGVLIVAQKEEVLRLSEAVSLSNWRRILTT